MRKRTLVVFLVAGLFCCAVMLASRSRALGAEADSPQVTPTNQTIALPATNPPDSSTNRDVIQQAIEELRREAEPVVAPPLEPPTATDRVAASERAEALEERLGLVERTLRLQHQSELEAVHSSNRTVLLAAIILAGVLLVGIVCGVLVLTRTINRLSEVTTRLSVAGGWGQSPALPALGAGELALATFGQPDQVNARFIGAIERLEQRIREMEQTAEQRPPIAAQLPASPPTGTGAKPVGEPTGPEPQPGSGNSKQESSHDRRSGKLARAAEETSHVSVLIGKGQALLNLGQSEEALRCFDEAIALEPGNAEAFVKRGMALEKLLKIEEALNSYNRAIAADDSMTLAYLHKGSVCNRLQRFREALECYERAMKGSPIRAGVNSINTTD